MARRYHVGGDDEFSDRENLGELPPEDENVIPESIRRPTLPPSHAPPGTPPGSPGGIPYGRFFQKRYREDFGQPSAPTGGIAPPIQRAPDGSPIYDEQHPLPAQLPRECWDYFFNLLRQMLVHVEKPTWIDPPARARPIDKYTKVCGQVIGPGATVSILSGTFTCPPANIGFVTRIGVSLGSETDWQTASFRLRKDGVDQEGYNDISIQIGSIDAPSRLAAPLALRRGDVVDLVCVNTGVANITAYGRIYGWFFPVQVETSDGSFRERIVD